MPDAVVHYRRASRGGSWAATVLALQLGSGLGFAADPPDPATFPEQGLLSLATTSGTVFGVEAAGSLPVPAAAVRPTFRDALLALAPTPPGYALRDVNGVPVLRPSTAWDAAGLLDVPLPARLNLREVPWREAVDRVCRAVGPPTLRWWDTMPADDIDVAARTEAGARRVTVDVAAGATVAAALSAIVRAHGALAWAASPSPPGTSLRIWTFHRQGHGCTIPASRE